MPYLAVTTTALHTSLAIDIIDVLVQASRLGKRLGSIGLCHRGNLALSQLSQALQELPIREFVNSLPDVRDRSFRRRFAIDPLCNHDHCPALSLGSAVPKLGC